MELWPAIDLLDGIPARLWRGQFAHVTTYPQTPLELASKLLSYHIRRVHLVDLSGAKAGAFTAFSELGQLVQAGFAVEVGGGFRDYDAIAQALDLGAARVVVGTRLITDRSFQEGLLQRFSADQVVVGIDVQNDRARLNGWVDEGPPAQALWQALTQQGYRWVNVTDIDRDGSLDGLRPGFWQAWAQMPGLIGAGGGITRQQDLEMLQQLGIPRAVVGKAWLEGHLVLEDEGGR